MVSDVDSQLARFAELDQRLVAAASGVKVLSRLTWPNHVAAEFLLHWEAKRPRLPDVSYPHFDFERNIAELRAVADLCDLSHPVGRYIARTARSYITAARMLENIGSPAFTELSAALYGKPDDPIGSDDVTNLDAAEHFIEATNEFALVCATPEEEFHLEAEHVAEMLRKELEPYFRDHQLEIVIDPSLASKAAAGASRIRIRGASRFSTMDIGQLLQHEAYVHTVTMLNGRRQPALKSMGLGSPRTTLTQEGLATFAELITGVIDLSRLRRIALRTKAIQMGLEGADFLEVFEYFWEAGQTPQESFQSAMRVFRGGDPNGRIVFMKDVVYLKGLLFLHTFLRKAVQSNKNEYSRHLFAGRLALGDVIALEPYFKSGFIADPVYVPQWIASRHCLAAYLNYSIFINRINLGRIQLDDFIDRDE